MSIESVPRRVLGAIRIIDAATKLQISRPLRVECVDPQGVRLIRNRRGLHVVDFVPALADHSAEFSAPPSLPALRSVAVRLKISDPQESYLPRLFRLELPRDADPDHADRPESLFQAVDVPLFPAPAAAIAPGMAVLRASIAGTRGGTTQNLSGALIRVLRKPGDATPIARGLSDARGQALVAVVGIPTMTFADDTDGEAVLSPGAMVNLEVMFDPQAGAPPDPDQLDTLSSLLPETPLKLISGRETVVSLTVVLP